MNRTRPYLEGKYTFVVLPEGAKESPVLGVKLNVKPFENWMLKVRDIQFSNDENENVDVKFACGLCLPNRDIKKSEQKELTKMMQQVMLDIIEVSLYNRSIQVKEQGQ